jgi:uncharacterized protein (TIGR02145 family)
MYSLALLMLMGITGAQAQVTIGTLNTPHDNAILDLSGVGAKKLGLMLPQVSLSDLSAWSLAEGIGTDADATGMLIYNTNTKIGAGAGIYVWNNNKWNPTSSNLGNIIRVIDFTLPQTAVINGISTSIEIEVTGILLADATYKGVTWSVSNEKLNTNGVLSATTEVISIVPQPDLKSVLVTGLQRGIATLTATSIDGKTSKSCQIEVFTACPSSVTAASPQSGTTYLTASFGAAGCWMTENLAETAYAYSSPWSALKNIAPVNTQAQYRNYNFPKSATPYNAVPADNLAWARYTDAYQTGLGKPGLLYSFNAASDLPDIAIDGGLAQTTNRYPAGRTDTVYRQGICPTGWHLPSDTEWSALEKEIALNPVAYAGSGLPSPYPAGDFPESLNAYDYFGSATGYRPFNNTTAGLGAASAHNGSWGYQMKATYKPSGTTSVVDADGVSKLATAGGFSGLLVGYATSGWTGFGSYAFFWSSSSTSASGGSRGLRSNNSGVNRNNYDKYYLFSVRCKKN